MHPNLHQQVSFHLLTIVPIHPFQSNQQILSLIPIMQMLLLDLHPYHHFLNKISIYIINHTFDAMVSPSFGKSSTSRKWSELALPKTQIWDNYYILINISFISNFQWLNILYWLTCNIFNFLSILHWTQWFFNMYKWWWYIYNHYGFRLK